MPRISYRPYEQLDPRSRGYVDYARDHGTPRPESQAIRAHVPDVLEAFTQAWRMTFEQGVLDNPTKELCRLYISRSVECEYCGNQRSELAAAAGLDEGKIDELMDFERSDRYTERERTALRYAEAIAWDAALADDEVWEDLHRHFTEAQLVELGFFIGLTLGQQRWIKTLRVGHLEYLPDTTTGLLPGFSVADA